MQWPDPSWDLWEGQLRQGARRAVAEWFRRARVCGGGAPALGPGSIGADSDFRMTMLLEAMRLGTPRHVADAFASTLSDAWAGWFAGYRATLRFHEIDSPDEPAPSVPCPISVGSSAADEALFSRALSKAVRGCLAQLATASEAVEAILRFADWFSERFARWRDRAVLQEVTADPKTGELASRRGILTDLGVFDG